MESKDKDQEIPLFLIKQGKKIFKTIIPADEPIETIYKILLETKKISSEDILTDSDGIELDIVRVKAKHIDSGNLYIHSDFQEASAKNSLVTKESDIKTQSIQDSFPITPNLKEFRFTISVGDLNNIEWEDLNMDDKLMLVQNLCCFGYRENSKGKFQQTRKIWNISSIQGEAFTILKDQAGTIWTSKVILDLNLCTKELVPKIHDFHKDDKSLEKFYEEFGPYVLDKVEIGYINLNKFPDEERWRYEYNFSEFSEVIRTDLVSAEDDKYEVHYNWAITNLKSLKDSRSLLREFSNSSGEEIPIKSIALEASPKVKETSLYSYEGEMKDGLMHGRGIIKFKNGDQYIGELRDDEIWGKGVFQNSDSSRYEGDFVKGKKHGYGIFVFTNKDCYEGEFKDDRIHGKGIYCVHNGNKYDGEFHNGMKQGKGQFTFNTGDRYEGDMWNDQIHGIGTYFTKNGNKYEGQFEKGKKNGNGTFYFANGNKYIGEFKEDKIHGQGIYYVNNGNKYEGEFQNGMKTGKGVYFFAEGDRYEGMMFEDKIHGKGTYYVRNGNKYEGDFVFGKKEGKGTFSFQDGNKYVGEFKDDKIHGKGEYFFKNGNKYKGEYVNGQKCGKGKFTWNDGSVYLGEFRDDMMNGRGDYFWENGDKYSGIWLNGEKHGKGTFKTADGDTYEELWNFGQKIDRVLNTVTKFFQVGASFKSSDD